LRPEQIDVGAPRTQADDGLDRDTADVPSNMLRNLYAYLSVSQAYLNRNSFETLQNMVV
jgi:hypothetical protein